MPLFGLLRLIIRNKLIMTLKGYIIHNIAIRCIIEYRRRY
nr:MAG TPA: hypothetical protein [Caudoviricetes sp.]